MFSVLVKRAFASKEIEIDGAAPWDIQVLNPKFYAEVALHGSLGLGDSYMKGYWTCESLDQLFYRLSKDGIPNSSLRWLQDLPLLIKHKFFNLQNMRGAKEVCETHYNQDPQLFQKLLDPRLAYSSANWSEGGDLDSAQNDKLKFVCDALELKSGDRVADVGCGWGSFTNFASEKCGTETTGFSLAQEQIAFAKNRAHERSNFVYTDYRNIKGLYDHVASIEMFEAVGHKNFATFMKKMRSLVKDKGSFFLQTVGRNDEKLTGDRWTDKHIFPNGSLPTLGQIEDSAKDSWNVEVLAERGLDYDKTLMAWRQNLDAMPSDAIASTERRKWEYYFSSFAGTFRSGHCLLYQCLLTAK